MCDFYVCGTGQKFNSLFFPSNGHRTAVNHPVVNRISPICERIIQFDLWNSQSLRSIMEKNWLKRTICSQNDLKWP